jgi:hypothetical protein
MVGVCLAATAVDLGTTINPETEEGNKESLPQASTTQQNRYIMKEQRK